VLVSFFLQASYVTFVGAALLVLVLLLYFRGVVFLFILVLGANKVK
jgi:hypothetical protein